MDIQAINEHLYGEGVALIGMEGDPFDSTVCFNFRDCSGSTFSVRLIGVHLLTTRRSLCVQAPPAKLAEGQWENWYVHYFEVMSDSELLRQFLQKELRFAIGITPFSLNGADESRSEFVKPVHVALLAGDGAVEAICESVEVVPRQTQS